MNVLHLTTDRGDIDIREDGLASITDADLKQWGISRKELHRCFAEGVHLMQSAKPGEMVRPVAWQGANGTWVVHLIGYSPVTNPLQDDPGGHG